jgi:RNA polymerase sigma factor (sigma-70 family)
MVQPQPTRSDEELMTAYVAGETGAFELLFQRYAQVLYRVVRRRLASDADAHDVVQQTLLQLHRARHDFRSGAPLRPWLFTIALNLVREHHRRRGRRREQPLDEAKRAEQASPEPLPEAAREAGERLARVRSALSSLPEPQRSVIELHLFDELPYEEIALIVGASVAAVRVRAHRGYERLREILPRSG